MKAAVYIGVSKIQYNLYHYSMFVLKPNKMKLGLSTVRHWEKMFNIVLAIAARNKVVL